jgi:REP element-mobilizing transposase RayT
MTMRTPPPRAPHRKRLRLAGYDYTERGLYFVTVCTEGKRCIFGQIREGRMRPGPLGRIVLEEWTRMAERSPWVHIHAFVLMPNHVHGSIGIGREEGDPDLEGVPRPSLSRIVGAFKGESGRRINIARGTPGRTDWQRGFHDHIIRTERALDRIHDYIEDNPFRWSEDRYYRNRPS